MTLPVTFHVTNFVKLSNAGVIIKITCNFLPKLPTWEKIIVSIEAILFIFSNILNIIKYKINLIENKKLKNPILFFKIPLRNSFF